jgi:hypothetical protein
VLSKFPFNGPVLERGVQPYLKTIVLECTVSRNMLGLMLTSSAEFGKELLPGWREKSVCVLGWDR